MSFEFVRYARSAALLTVFWLSAQFGYAQSAPVVTSKPAEGTKTISGFLCPCGTGSPTTMRVLVDGTEAPIIHPFFNFTTREFQVELVTPLKGGQTFSVEQTTGTTKSDLSVPIRIPGVPNIKAPLTAGMKKVEGTVAKNAPPIEVTEKDGSGVVVQRKSVDPSSDQFAATFDNALTEGNLVIAREKDGDFSDPVKVSPKPPVPVKPPSPPTINSIDAVYGSSKVTIYFGKLDSGVTGATVTVTTCLETAVHTFTDDELKATKVDVPLSKGLYCGPDADLTGIKFVVKDKNGTSDPAANPSSMKIVAPRITLNELLREGDFEVKGTVSSGVSKVRIEVHGGWAAYQPQFRRDRAGAQGASSTKPAPAGTSEETLAKPQSPYVYQGPRAQRVANALASLTGTSNAEDLSRQKYQAILRCLVSELTQSPVEATITNAAFDVKLDSRLDGGDCVIAIPVLDPPASAPDADLGLLASNTLIVQSVLLDWGRMRGYFSVGGGISQYRSHFSQVDTFVGFTIDGRLLGYNLLAHSKTAGCKSPETQRKEQAKSSNNKSEDVGCVPADQFKLGNGFRAQLNMFADGRVGVQLASTGASTSTSSTASASTAPTAGQAATPAPSTPPNQLNLNTMQPGYFQFGLHLPISFGGLDWTHHGKAYSFYFGPIGKIGGQTLDSDLILSRHLTINAGKQPTDSTYYSVASEDKRSGVLPFYSYGTRLGVFAYDLLGKPLSPDHNEKQVANDPVAYLDFTWGKNHAYRSYTFSDICSLAVNGVNTPSSCSSPGATKSGLNIDSGLNNQFMIEARLKIPFLPALIGLDYASRAKTSDQDPNLLRFVVAFRIDAQKALSKVFGGDLRQ